MQASSFFIGPSKTPNLIKYLIWLTAIVSILTPIVSFAMLYFLQQPGPQIWLPLSRIGLIKGWFWQPITYIFIHSIGTRIQLSLFVSLFFHLFLLWIMGSEILSRFGKKAFFLFYFGAALFAALITAAFLFLFSSNAFIYGSTPSIYALLIVWTMLYPELELSFLFLIRIKVKWLVLIFFAISFFMQISSGNWYLLLSALSGIAWGYLAGRFLWKLPNPFPYSQKGQQKRGKIIDISQFQEDDDAFMDRMLDKITKKGHSSLTTKEREKMDRISKGKK